MKAYILTVCLLLTIGLSSLFSQSVNSDLPADKVLDSLINELPNLEDTQRVRILNSIAYKYYYVQPEKTLEYASEAVSLAKELNDLRGLAESQRLMGIANQLNNRHKECLEWLFKGLATAEEIGYDQGVADNYNSIGVLYTTVRDWEQAILFFQKSLLYQRKSENQLREALVLSNIGDCYLNLHNLDSAVSFIDKAHDIFEKVGDEAWISMNLIRKAKYLLNSGEYRSTAIHASRAVELAEKHDQQFHLKEAYHVMATAQYMQNQFAEAEQNELKALKFALKMGFLPAITESYASLVKIYEGQRNYRKAFNTQEIYIAYKDSTHSQEDKYALDHLRFQSELDQKEKDYLILKSEKERHEAENSANQAIIQRQNTIGIATTISLIGFAISAFIFFYLRQKERKANAILSLKNKELNEQKQKLSSTLQVVEMLNSQIEAQNNTMKHVAIVSITDLEGNIVNVNDNFIRISGYSQNEILGKKHNFLKSGYHPKKFYREIWDTINSGETWRGEIRNKTKSGRVFWTDTAIAPILDENEKPKQYFSLQFEITRRKEYEEQLQKQKEELAELNTLKDKLFSVVSHDFRSPLRSLKGTLSLYLQGAITPDEMHMLAGDLSEKLDITSNMLDNLLNWAKSQMKGVHMKKEQIDLYNITRDNLELQRSMTDKKKLEIVNKIEESSRAYADSEMIKVVLRNLISNAIKFSSVGDRIVIEAQKKNGTIITSIKDEGIGMDREKQKNLFSFDITSSPGTANESGIGIGLALCRDFINRNDGEIWVESIEDHGSTFYFSLPVS
jgi:PAS domain S-box-containing protein